MSEEECLAMDLFVFIGVTVFLPLPVIKPNPTPLGISRHGVFNHCVSVGLAGIQRARTCDGVTVKSGIRLSAR